MIRFALDTFVGIMILSLTIHSRENKIEIQISLRPTQQLYTTRFSDPQSVF